MPGSYYRGEGVPNDFAEATRLFRRVADQGHVLAQYNLGMCYLNGEGVEKDDKEAVRWIRLAAEQGLTQAQLEDCIFVV